MADQPPDRAPEAGNDIRETAIAKAMTSTSIHKHPTAFFNTRLPVLEVALDVQMMTATLEPLLKPLARGDSAPTVVYAKLLAYKQGNRGLIQYEVGGTDQADSLVVFGKLYPDPAQMMRVYETMHILWNEVFTDDPRLSLPRPLGCVTDLTMLVYIPAEGRFLDEVIGSDQTLDAMDLAGAWLGTLHRHKLPLDRQFRVTTELVNLQAWSALIGHKYPDQAEAAARIAGHLKDRATDLQFEMQSPIHKDFHYGHIVVGDNGLKVIDLDEMRLGDPNFDLAHFCANLHLLAYRKSDAPFTFSTLQSAFLGAYARKTGWTSNERFVYFYAYTCLKITKQLCSRRGLRPRPEGEEQERQVRLMLEQGLASLPRDTTKKLSGKFATMIMEAPVRPQEDDA